MGVFKDFANLIKGLSITGKHLGRHAVTLQYPEERAEMFDCSRGIVVLLSDKETGELNCTSCQLCERACPSSAITIEWHKEEGVKGKILDKFVVDTGLCCFCGLCEEACNFSAIKLATKYEWSVFDRGETIWDKDKLQEVGRDVPYEDTRRKKKTDRPKTAARAEKKEARGDKEAEPADAKDKKADKNGSKADAEAKVETTERPPKAAGSESEAEKSKAEDKPEAGDNESKKPSPQDDSKKDQG